MISLNLLSPEKESEKLAMDTIIAWVKSKNITAHSIAAAAIALAGLYSTDQQFRDFILSLVQNHPKIAADITLAVGMILKYSHSSSAAGTVATAQTILASPKAPTPEAVEAAKVTK